MAGTPDVEPSCAICGASSQYGECPHEGQRLELALEQAAKRWEEMRTIREWVLNHARDQILHTFQQLKETRYQAHIQYLQTLPCYTIYQKYRGNPPLAPAQLNLLHSQMGQAQSIFQSGIDEDWRRSCLRYPEVLDYYFSLVEFKLPDDRDAAVRDPRFGSPLKETRKIKSRRDSLNSNGHRKKERRRSSRGRTPPLAPMAASFRR